MIASKDVEEQYHYSHDQRPTYNELQLGSCEEDARHPFYVSFSEDLDQDAGQHATDAHTFEDLHLMCDMELVPCEIIQQSSQREETQLYNEQSKLG